MIKYLLLLMLTSPTYASSYMEWSLEAHDENRDSFRQIGGESIRNILGSVELGYTFDKNKSIYIRHTSSVEQADTGLNTIGLKVRVW